MQNRTALVVLTIALCASFALGGVDVAVKTVSPSDSEAYGLVPVQVRLTNVGDVPALVPRLDVGVPPDYSDSLLNMSVGVGQDTLVTLNPWVCPPSGTAIFTAWITYPADTNHHNDTDIVTVHASGISDRVERKPCAVVSLTLLPSPLAGNVLHIEYGLNQAGPANVTLFDISGRPVVTRRFAADRAGELPMDLRLLSSGVYLVRLDEGRSAVTQKLVVRR